ncbi:MAG: hypothetical protein ACTSU5_11605 [Promethearchaeota archaeon]
MASLTFVGISAGVMSLGASTMILFIAYRLFQRYREKKNRATLFLIASTLAFAVTCLSGTATYFIAPFNLPLAIVTNAIIYTFTFLATMLMFMFASEVFFQADKKWIVAYLVAGFTIIALILFTDSVATEMIGDYPVLVLKDLYTVLLVAYLIPTNLGIFWVARRASGKVEDPLYAAGYRAISWGDLMPLLAFVADASASFSMTVEWLYTAFLLLTWVFPIIAVFFLYAGYILPDWFKKRVSAKLARESK